ncbi:hypothetical protein [Commensalibacter oyaizuii]|uniref:Uncharacterized protein n=1 Tax=Commensalibacter oyaizuii TaxID=3043873 RepID=A0ABT6Q3F4_9PROT|nr:hypothetical protein [Commensalibacter sp. TBRC 16381]MDI2091635.1 hypothetical protein [Commensalibacter sp. TBRC 16381]
MDLLIAKHSVPFDQADKTPVNGTPQYATDGDPARGIPATLFPASHFNALQHEIVNAIKVGGKSPDKDDWNQLGGIIIKIFDQIGNVDGRFKNIKEVGKDKDGVYVIVSEDGKADEKIYLLTPSDLKDIYQRLWSVEGSISDIIHKELPAKADLNGNSNQDFDTATLKGNLVKTGGLAITGGVLTHYAYLDHAPGPGMVPSWGFNQIPNDNNVWQLVAYDQNDPSDKNKITAFIEMRKQNSNYQNKSTVFITQTLIAPNKADMAELYEADTKNIAVGQVMMRGGKNEITICTNPARAIGIYSQDPAYILNGKEDMGMHVPIALIGRVPVLVEGPVTLDDHIAPTDHGTAIASRNPSDVWLGCPLREDLDTKTRLVECLVRAVI